MINADETLSNLVGTVGEVQMTVQIIRKATNKVEEFKLTGFVDEAKLRSYKMSEELIEPQAETVVEVPFVEALPEVQVKTISVDVDGVITTRTYSDGAVQRNVWETPEQAQEYKQSVFKVEGLQ